jgi:DNA-binding response OmpR family regulator
MPKILFVEDDDLFASSVMSWFQNKNYAFDRVSLGEDAIYLAAQQHYDLAIIDWSLPDMTGLKVCEQLRAAKSAIPILMLTGRTDPDDRVLGLNSGSDDYLGKPCHARELEARIRALLRRPQEYTGTAITVGSLELDSCTLAVRLDGNPIEVQAREFGLLEFLVRNRGRIYNAETLVSRLWPTETEVSKEIVKVYVNRLRQKLLRPGKEPLIKTLRGAGYKFEWTD